jgi:pSer/pThr/pTyr-binding forkhead associated (FHA) protein
MSSRSDSLLGERTAVDLDLPEARGEDPAVVEVLGGPDRGRRYRLPLGLTSVGRGRNNDFILTDPAASRQHLLLVRSESGVCARDLDSGNGTLRNGCLLGGETALLDGDALELGQTQLRFVGAAALPVPEVDRPEVPRLSLPFEDHVPRPRAKTLPRPSQDLRPSLRRRARRIAAVALVLLGLGLAAVRYGGRPRPSEEPVSTEALLPAP